MVNYFHVVLALFLVLMGWPLLGNENGDPTPVPLQNNLYEYCSPGMGRFQDAHPPHRLFLPTPPPPPTTTLSQVPHPPTLLLTTLTVGSTSLTYYSSIPNNVLRSSQHRWKFTEIVIRTGKIIWERVDVLIGLLLNFIAIICNFERCTASDAA